MDKVYAVFAYYEAYDYDIDSRCHLCGVYLDKDKAVQRLKKLVTISSELKRKYNKDFSEYEYPEPTDPLKAFYEDANNKLGFSIEPFHDISNEWDLSFNLFEFNIGDISFAIYGRC